MNRKRFTGEKYSDYKTSLHNQKQLLKKYLKGYLVESATSNREARRQEKKTGVSQKKD